jgi:G1/S-specific cyclin PLC1
MAVSRDMMEAAIYHLTQLPVTPDVISYIAQKATKVVPLKLCPIPNRPFHGGESTTPSVLAFVKSVVWKSDVRMPTLVTSLVYLNRLQMCLSPTSTGKPTSPHRVFLAALILAAKNLNDKSPKNKHWARYSSVKNCENDTFEFDVNEVNLMERQLLSLLDWRIRVELEDLYYLLQPMLAVVRRRSLVAIQPSPSISCRHVRCASAPLSVSARNLGNTRICKSRQGRLDRWLNLLSMAKVCRRSASDKCRIFLC